MYNVYYEFTNKEAHVAKIEDMKEFEVLGERINKDAIKAGTEIKELRIKREK